MSAPCPNALARLLEGSPLDALGIVIDGYRALLGMPTEWEPLGQDGDAIAARFGEQPLYVFPIRDAGSDRHGAMLVMDLRAAIHAGGSFSMMATEQIRRVVESGAVPPIVHESAVEVAAMLVEALSRGLGSRDPDARPLTIGTCERIDAPAWPGVLESLGLEDGRQSVAARLSIDGEDWGALAIAASQHPLAAQAAHPRVERTAAPPSRQALAVEADAALSTAPIEEEPALPPGVLVLVVASHDDVPARLLRQRLGRIGVGVSRHRRVHASARRADAVFLVCRTAGELRVKLAEVEGPERPPLVVACSDRATRELVMAARRGRADEFLVLPADLDRLRALIARAIESPAATMR